MLTPIIAVNDSYTIAATTTPTTFDVLANDTGGSGTLSISSVSTVPYGSVSIVPGGHQTLSFTPSPGFSGIEQFTYNIMDPAGDYSTATVSVTVTGGMSSTAPQVSSLSTHSGSTLGGTGVTISGSRYNSVTAVLFGGVAASSFTVNSSSQISAVAPAHTAGAVDVTVITSMGSSAVSSSDQFTFQAPAALPTISAISPGTATTSGGAAITITGTNFTGVSGVSFGSTPASSYTVNSPTTITAISPVASSGLVDIHVTNAIGTSVATTNDEILFTTPILPPVVTSLSIANGSVSGGQSINITGANFTNITSVKFGAVAATSFVVNSSNSITAVAPAEAPGAVDVTVTNSAGTSGANQSDQYTYQTSLPTITGLSTTSGSSAGGTTLTITGTNFSNATGVLFGTVPASSWLVSSPTTISVVTPAETIGTVDVTIQSGSSNSAVSSSDKFSFVSPAPTISGLSISSGLTTGSTSVTISGSQLSTATSVLFGAYPATSFVLNSNGTITAVAPAQSVGTVDIHVGNINGMSPTTSSDQFTYLNPPAVVSGLSTATGYSTGGLSLTISGSRFTGASSVLFGTVPSPNFTVINDTSIRVIVPSEAVGTVDIIVVNLSGSSSTSISDRFSYVAPPIVPIVTGLGSAVSSLSGNHPITISGSKFTGATNVLFGAVPAVSFHVNSDGTITAVEPAMSAGTVDVTVINAGGASATSTADQLTYTNSLPVVSGLNLPTASTRGGDSIVISGSNFTGTTSVTFGGVAAQSFIVTSATSITAIAPAVSSATVDIVVTTPIGSSITSTTDQLRFQTTWTNGATSGSTTPNRLGVPVIDGIDTNIGSVAGGATVTIHGIGFNSVTSVIFGAVPAASYVINSDNSITATSPAQTAGSVNILLQSPAGTSIAAGNNQFVVAPPNAVPSITGIAMAPNSSGAGSLVSIQGSNFVGVSSVLFGGSLAAFNVVNPTTILAIVPAGASGTVNVSVANANGTSPSTLGAQLSLGSSPIRLPTASSTTGEYTFPTVTLPVSSSSLVSAQLLSQPDMPTVQTFSPVATVNYSYVGPGNWTSNSVVTDSGSNTTISTSVATLPGGWQEMITTTKTVIVAFDYSYTSGSGVVPVSTVNLSQTTTTNVSDTMLAANGTGYTHYTSQTSIQSYQNSLTNGTRTFSLDTYSTSTAGELAIGTSASTSASASAPADTATDSFVDTVTNITSWSGSSSGMVVRQTYANIGNDSYDDITSDKTATDNASETDSGSDQWNQTIGEVGTYDANGNPVSGSELTHSQSSGNDSYNLNDNNTSTVTTGDPNGSTTVYDVQTTTDSGFDEYSFNDNGTLNINNGSLASGTVNNNDSADGNEDLQIGDIGWIQQNENYGGGLTLAAHDDFADSTEDKSTYLEGNLENASTLSIGTDKITDNTSDNVQFGSIDNATESTTQINFYGTPTVASITDNLSDQGTLTASNNLNDTESILGTAGVCTNGVGLFGYSDVGDAITFDSKGVEQDTAIDGLTGSVTTIGQVGASQVGAKESVNSQETFSQNDTTTSNDKIDDPGTDNQTPTSDTESDNTTEVFTLGDVGNIQDNLTSTDTTTLADGTTIVLTSGINDTALVNSTGSDSTTDQHTSTLVGSDDLVTFNDQLTASENYTDKQVNGNVTTIPVAGGVLTSSASVSVTDTGTFGDKISAKGEADGANASLDNETDAITIVNSDSGVEQLQDSLFVNVTNPTTGEVTQINATDLYVDGFSESENLGASTTTTANNPSTESASASDKQSDSFTVNNGVTVGLIGSPSPGLSIDFFVQYGYSDSGQDSNDFEDSSGAFHSDSGTDTFSESDAGKINSTSHSYLTENATTDDSHGNSSSIYSVSKEDASVTASVNISDQGQDAFTDSNAIRTSDNRGDTLNESENLQPQDTLMTGETDKTVTTDPTTGLVSKSIYVSIGNDTISETDSTSFQDIDSKTLISGSTDVITGTNKLTGAEQSSDSFSNDVQIAGNIVPGETATLHNTFFQTDTTNDKFSNSDNLTADGTNTDSSTLTGTFNTPILYELHLGNISKYDPATRITTTEITQDVVDSKANDQLTSVDTIVIPVSGTSVDLPNVNDTGSLKQVWSMFDTLTQSGPSASSTTVTDVGTDSDSELNGVITDLGMTDFNSTTGSGGGSPPAVANPGDLFNLPQLGAPPAGVAANPSPPQSANAIQQTIAQLQIQQQALQKQIAESQAKVATINAKWTYGLGQSAASQNAIAAQLAFQKTGTDEITVLHSKIEAERAKLKAAGEHVPPSAINTVMVEPLEDVQAAFNSGFQQGLQTGAKAVVNGTATAVVNTATLGLNSSQIQILTVTEADRAAGYDTSVAIVTSAGEVLIGVGTAGATSGLCKGGRFARAVGGALTVYDAAGNVVGVGKGAADAIQNGQLTVQNSLQIIGGGLGLAGNVGALKNLKNCFPAGTPISTPEGLRPIETIRTGDVVWAFNLVAGEWQQRHVLNTFEASNSFDLVQVTIGDETIQSTVFHPFWVVSGRDLDERPIRSHLEKPPEDSKIPGRWVDATDLRVGDQLLLRDGRRLPVERVRHVPIATTVYNFTVDELKCYAVGILQVLVHNTDCVPGAPRTPPLANVLEGHSAQQGFTGVIDSSTGKVLIRPSTAASDVPAGWVARRGGHADVSSALGGNAASHRGFAVILQEDGSLAVTWRSGVLNSPPDYVVPLEMRQSIVNAIEAATGRKVSSF